MRKLRTMLTLSAGGTATGFSEALEAATRAPLPDGLEVSWGMRIAGDPIEGTEHREAIGPHADGFEAFLDVAGEDADFGRLADAIEPVLQSVAHRIDAARSAVLAGDHHLLMPRFGPHMMIFALRRRPDVTPEFFFDYWANRHGPMVVKGFDGRGSYYQLHGREAETRSLADRLGFGIADFDGHAGFWLSDPAVLGRSLRSDSAHTALEDERRFIDHRRSYMAVYLLHPAPA